MATPRDSRGGSAPVKKRNPIKVAPSGPPPVPNYTGTPSYTAATTPPKTPGKDGDKAAADAAAAAKDPYAAAQAKAQAEADKAARKAANRYREQAANLEAQAVALRHALRVDLKAGLMQQLSDIVESRKQQADLIREGYTERYGQLKGSAKDNEKATAAATNANMLNATRERNSAVSEAMMQGAGESDLLGSMMMSLRNWNANQSEVQRSYFDTLRSVNTSLTDLNVDTKTALANNHVQANADREQLWTNYRNQRSEILTQLGNTRGQQADYYAMAKEMDPGKGGDDKDKVTVTASASSSSKAKGGLGKPNLDGGKDTPRPSNARLATWEDGADPRNPGFRAERGKGPEIPGGAGAGRRRTRGGGGGLGGDVRNAKQAKSAAAAAFMASSRELGQSWDNPGIPDQVMDWQGKDPFAATMTGPARLSGAMTTRLDKVPEGATLRKW